MSPDLYRPVAVRRSSTQKAHRSYRRTQLRTRCGLIKKDMTEQVFVDELTREQLCTRCWPDPKRSE